MTPIRITRRSLLAGLAAAALPLGALAQNYPAKPVTIVVPFAPGGTTDILARIVGQGLGTELGQPFVVDNRAGAGGNIGASLAAKAPADGYTLFMGTVGTHAINQALYKKMPFDPVKDFAPISRVATGANLLVAHPSQPYKTVKELIAYAKANPGKVTYGSPGSGASAPCVGRAVQEHDRHRPAACALQGQRPGHDRPAGWADRHHVRQHAVSHPACALGQAAPHRRDHGQALARAA